MRPVIVTRVAHAGVDDHRFFGHGALEDLLGHETQTGLLGLGILGRRLAPDERELLDAMGVSLMAADPRIWPLKLGRLVASYGEMLAGYAAGQLAMIGPKVGARTTTAAAEHLIRLRTLIGEERDEAVVASHIEAYIRTEARLEGYGVPLREKDERLEALRPYMVRTGRAERPYWRLQETLSATLRKSRPVEPNIIIGIAAGLLDMGCNPAQAGALATFLIDQCFVGNTFEAAQQMSPDARRLPDACIDYVGRAPRRSPRSA
jgi:hypothetical protein